MNDLDELMRRFEEANQKEALDLTTADLETIIDMHRRQRARRAAGEKPQKPAGPSIDISHITKKLIKSVPPTVTITRRKI